MKKIQLFLVLFFSAACTSIIVSPTWFWPKRSITPEELQQKLFAAVEKGHCKTIASLIADGADVNSPDTGGYTVLWWAVRNGDIKTADCLLRNGAEPSLNKVSFSGDTPLLVACKSNNFDMVKALLSHGARYGINERDAEGRTALMVVCCERKSGEKKCALATLLLEHGADVNASDYEGNFPLIEACRQGHRTLVVLLLSHKADVNKVDDKERNALLIACCDNNPVIAKILIDAGAKVNGTGSSSACPLLAACDNKNISTMKLLLKEGASVTLRGRNKSVPLIMSCRNIADQQISRLLLAHGADLADVTGSALRDCVRKFDALCTNSSISPFENYHDLAKKVGLDGGTWGESENILVLLYRAFYKFPLVYEWLELDQKVCRAMESGADRYAWQSVFED